MVIALEHGTLTVCANPSPEWSLQVPLSALVQLQELPQRMKTLEGENKKLRRELDALRTIQSQTLQVIADMRRERMGG